MLIPWNDCKIGKPPSRLINGKKKRKRKHILPILETKEDDCINAMDIKKIINECDEKFYVHMFDNLNKMD